MLKLDFLVTIFYSNTWDNCVGLAFVNEKVLQWEESNYLYICCLFCHLHLYTFHIYKNFLLDGSLFWLSCSVSVLPCLSQSEREMLCMCAEWGISVQSSVLPFVFSFLPYYRRDLIVHFIFFSETLCIVHKKLPSVMYWSVTEWF